MKNKSKKVLDNRCLPVVTRYMDNKELKRILRKSQISQKELAERVGVTEAAVSRWVSGKRKMHPAFGTLIRQAVQKKRVA